MTHKRSTSRRPSPKQPTRKKAEQKKPRKQPTPVASAAPAPLPDLRLGFVRGVAPSKWAERWARAATGQHLELVPVDLHQVDTARGKVDVLLERVPHGNQPPGTDGDQGARARTRHAVRLYEEGVALVVQADHELAKQTEVSLEDLALINLLTHPDHLPEWPATEPWADPSWTPQDALATLELVGAGLGGALLAMPLARHLVTKRVHAVVPVSHNGEPLLPGTEIWASWSVERDANDVQHLVGIMRGRTQRSSR